MKNLLLALITAISFSSFIYFEEFNLTNYFLNSILALFSIYMLLTIPKKAIFITGFFIGIFLFYWIGYSFKYNGVGYLTPFITVGFGIIYMLFFSPLALTNRSYIRLIILFLLSFIEPFNFNWLKFELLFVNSYFNITKVDFLLILIAIGLFIELKKYYKTLSLIPLLITLNLTQPTLKEPPLKIKLIQTDIAQEDKWLLKNREKIVKQNIDYIKKAIKDNYDLVILPESTFPLFLNYNPEILYRLKELSKSISIIAGALYAESNKHYNVTYFIDNQNIQIAKKMVLVPFGEYIPLPNFARDFINNTFFNGLADFDHADKPTDFNIKGTKFRNAICYEATTDDIFQGDVEYVIAISNNAWFMPSIEPTLQKLLMKYYAKKYNAIIYHSANIAKTGVIKP